MYATSPWLTVAYCCLMQAFTLGFGFYAFAFFVVPWTAEFGVNRSSLMLAITASAVASPLISPLGGILLDRLDSKKLILGGLAIYCLGLLAVAAAPSYLVVVAVFGLVLPVAITLAGPLTAYSLVARTATGKLGLALGITSLGSSIGGLVMPVVVTGLLGMYSWRLVFTIVAALIMLCVFVPGLVLLKKSIPAPSGDGHHGGTLQLMRSRAVIQLGLSYLLPSMMFIAILHNIGAYAADIGVSQPQAALIISASSVLTAIGKIGSGYLSDRLNHTVLYVGIVTVIAIGMFITGLSTAFAPLLAGVCLVALVLGGISPFVASLVANRWGTARFGRVMGVIYAFAALSGIGPLVAAAIRDSTGSYSHVFMWMTVALVPGIVCFLTLPKAVAVPAEPGPIRA